MFIREVFGDYSPDSIDEETLATIDKFFENNLNVSETSRQLFIHRNTLVYRLDKIQKNTNLDLRNFEECTHLNCTGGSKIYETYGYNGLEYDDHIKKCNERI